MTTTWNTLLRYRRPVLSSSCLGLLFRHELCTLHQPRDNLARDLAVFSAARTPLTDRLRDFEENSLRRIGREGKANMCAVAVRFGTGNNRGTGARLVRRVNKITVKNIPLEIWYNKQGDIFCLDKHQMTSV